MTPAEHRDLFMQVPPGPRRARMADLAAQVLTIARRLAPDDPRRRDATELAVRLRLGFVAIDNPTPQQRRRARITTRQHADRTAP